MADGTDEGGNCSSILRSSNKTVRRARCKLAVVHFGSQGPNVLARSGQHAEAGKLQFSSGAEASE